MKLAIIQAAALAAMFLIAAAVRLVVARRQGVHGVEAADAAGADGSRADCIAEALTDMMSVLHPDQASVVESEPVRTFFKSVRDANYRLRKAEALKRWKESERKRMKTERTRAILNHTRSYQHA